MNILANSKVLIFLVLWISIYDDAITAQSATQYTLTSSSSLIRIKANKLRRPEFCRENLPRKSDDLPNLVITGRIKEVYGEPTLPGFLLLNNNGTSTNSSSNELANRALVSITRVIKGNQQLVSADILVVGFNSNSSCLNYIKPNDSYILLLNQLEDNRKYAIQGNNILSMNLNNLDRVNQIASDEPMKRRGLIEDILCEAHYCPYGRCKVLNADLPQLTCHCPDSCPPLPAPVCGSDNTTYTNECLLIKEGCRQQRPLFITKESSC